MNFTCNKWKYDMVMIASLGETAREWRAAFRRPSFGEKRASDCLRSAAPASTVNELTLTNAPFGIVRGKTGGLAHHRRAAPRDQSRSFAPQPALVLAGTTRPPCSSTRAWRARRRSGTSSSRFQPDLLTRNFRHYYLKHAGSNS